MIAAKHVWNFETASAFLSKRNGPKRKLYLKNPEAKVGMIERLANSLNSIQPEQCWEWTWGVNKSGYGKTTIAKRFVYAHRLAYEMAVGPIPSGLLVLHKCDNPRCINPNHLEIGDYAKNSADMSARGRSTRGERGARKLTKQQVEQIRQMAIHGHTQRAIAKLFNVAQASVWRIVSGKAWR
jgi:hypothetical protein